MGSRRDLLFRVASIVGAVGLALWVVLWLVTFGNQALPLGERMWFQFPVLGADFWSQSAYAAKIWMSGGNPYAPRVHLFPYPPLVIRLFLWVAYFSLTDALRIWFVAMASVAIAATIVAHRARRRLGLWMPPLTLSILAVVVSYPVLFQLERGNCDLVTVATILGALPLLSRSGRVAEFFAGALLSIGPWVKFYPGLMGFGLVALRRPWAVLGFAAGGAAIFLSMFTETKQSLEVLSILMARTRFASAFGTFPTWSHSLSHAWILITHGLSGNAGLAFLSRISPLTVAGLLVVVAISPVCIRILRRPDSAVLTYPLLLWICAVASCAPIIANDYSLVFYPLAVVASADPRDPWSARVGILASLLSWQPFLVPVSPWIVLLSKLAGLAGVGVSLWRRAGRTAVT